MKRSTLRAGGLVLGLVLFTLVGCDPQTKKEKAAPLDPPSAASPQGTTGQAKAAQPAKAPSEKKPEKTGPASRTTKEVQDFVDSWVKAQNEGHFEAYSRLYATRFMGVKRAAGRTFHFDRAGWLEDRQKMFRKPMVVAASDVEVRTAANTSDVVFRQAWTSGAYADEGQKRLLIVEEKGNLAIAIEEMLVSELLGSKRDLGPGGFHFMLRGGVELHDVPIPEKLGTPRLVTDETVRTVVMTVSEEDLDPSVFALKGKKFRVDGECAGEVTGFEVVSRAELHFGQENLINCRFTDEPCTPATSEEIAEIVSGIGHQVLIAKLDNCAAGNVARLASEPQFIRGTPVTDASLKEQALAAFAQLKDVHKQVDSSAPESVPPNWWKGKEEVHIYEHPLSHRTIVAVGAAYGELCSSAVAECLQTWEVTATGLRPLGGCLTADRPVNAFDVNGDGFLELLVEPRVITGEERALIDLKSGGALLTQFYHYGDCPC